MRQEGRRFGGACVAYSNGRVEAKEPVDECLRSRDRAEVCRPQRMRGKRELLVEGRCTGKKRNQHREREGAGKYGKLWSQVTYQVGSRSALMDSIGRFILGGPEFRLMAQAPGIAKPAGPIGTQVR